MMGKIVGGRVKGPENWGREEVINCEIVENIATLAKGTVHNHSQTVYSCVKLRSMFVKKAFK